MREACKQLTAGRAGRLAGGRRRGGARGPLRPQEREAAGGSAWATGTRGCRQILNSQVPEAGRSRPEREQGRLWGGLSWFSEGRPPPRPRGAGGGREELAGSSIRAPVPSGASAS